MDYNLLNLYLQPLLVKRPTTAERVFSIAEVSKITELLDNLNAKLIVYSVLTFHPIRINKSQWFIKSTIVRRTSSYFFC